MFLKIYFIYLFLERGEGKQKGRERNIDVWLPLAHTHSGTWPATQPSALTENQSSHLSVHRPGLNPLSNTGQGEELSVSKNLPVPRVTNLQLG